MADLMEISCSWNVSPTYRVEGYQYTIYQWNFANKSRHFHPCMEPPKQIHWKVVCRILRYLKGIIGMEVLYRRRSTSTLDVVSFSYADWTGSSIDKRSTNGCTLVCGNLVTWRSKKQNVIARSSAEAKYRTMAYTVCELM